jgi:hypothetical protein
MICHSKSAIDPAVPHFKMSQRRRGGRAYGMLVKCKNVSILRICLSTIGPGITCLSAGDTPQGYSARCWCTLALHSFQNIAYVKSKLIHPTTRCALGGLLGQQARINKHFMPTLPSTMIMGHHHHHTTAAPMGGGGDAPRLRVPPLP